MTPPMEAWLAEAPRLMSGTTNGPKIFLVMDGVLNVTDDEEVARKIEHLEDLLEWLKRKPKERSPGK